MKQPSLRMIAGLLAALLLVGAVGFVLWRHGQSRTDHPAAAAAGFRESAAEAGLNFRMTFLAGEQGEKFKINLYDHGCGVAVGDFDGDGFDDVYFVNQLGTNALFRNRGDGTFEDVTARAGVGLGDRICVGATFADYDNDGRADLFVTSTRGGNILFHNNGDGTFTDVTRAAGLTAVSHSQTAVFFDYDNDGWLDLFVTNTARWTQEYDKSTHYFPGFPDFWQWAASPREFNVLYRNNHDGTFTDVTERAGLKGVGWGGDVAVFDFNDDGRLDLLVTNMFGASQLYRNDGNGTFSDVTRDLLGRTSWGAIGCKAFDFNNDGLLDLLIVDMHSDMWLPATIAPGSYEPSGLRRKYDRVMGPYHTRGPEFVETEERYRRTFQFRYEDVVFGNTLFKKAPSGKFTEVSDSAGMETFWPWGIATGDFDNDGYQDVFLPAGMGHPFGYWPNSLMMNNGNETFTDRAAALGMDPPPGGPFLEEPIGGARAARSSRCAATADFTNQGRLDLVVNNFNDRPYYFRNNLPRRNFIEFRLSGTASNRDAVGAIVRLHVGKEIMVRQVNPAGGYLSQSSLALHFGLGERPAVDRAEIHWPSGARQEIVQPAINTIHRVTEPK